MSMNRRDFMGLMFGAGTSLRIEGSPSAKTQSLFFEEDIKEGFSTLQGMTDETSAQFTIVLPVREKWTIEVAPNVPLTDLSVVTRDFSPYAVHKFMVEGLELGRTYRLSVRDEQGKVQDEREFEALDLNKCDVKISFASCANDHLNRDDIWHRFEAQNPDVVFFLGDNVYGDMVHWLEIQVADPRQLWERYVTTRNALAFYFQKRLKPVIATWDDHDFGGNNITGDYKYKNEAREIFETFYAQNPRPALIRGPGVSSRFCAFGADFFFLDGRTFRGAWKAPNTRMFGDQQESWIFGNIQPKPTWMINGSVYYGGYTGKDTFEGQYETDFLNFIGKLRQTPGLFCFASGDVHYSEIMDIEETQLGYPTFEMVSSSIHSFTFPGRQYLRENPRRRESTAHHNFTVFEGNFARGSIDGYISSVSAMRQEFKTPVYVRRPMA